MDAHHAERVKISVRKVEMQKKPLNFLPLVLAFWRHKAKFSILRVLSIQDLILPCSWVIVCFIHFLRSFRCRKVPGVLFHFLAAPKIIVILFQHFISVADTVEVCKYLMSKSSSPFSPGRLADGATPFWMACKKGRKDLVQAMVKTNKSHDILSLALKQVRKSVLTGEQN